jgi:hypothetical protein
MQGVCNLQSSTKLPNPDKYQHVAQFKQSSDGQDQLALQNSYPRHRKSSHSFHDMFLCQKPLTSQHNLYCSIREQVFNHNQQHLPRVVYLLSHDAT